MIMTQQENSLSSKDFSEQKPIKAKKRKKKAKKKVKKYSISKMFNTGNISEKYEYGLSDW